jgi:hypothetical protein
MAWTTPVIHAVGDVLASSDWNGLANDVSLLGGTNSQTVAASVNTTSNSYVSLTGGPAVTVTTGAHALVVLSCSYASGTANVPVLMAFGISGATTLAVADAQALEVATAGSLVFGASTVTIPVGWASTLNPGNNTFTCSYRSSVSGDTANFSNRSITVIPLP